MLLYCKCSKFFVYYTLCSQELDPLLFHHIFTLMKTNCMKIPRTTHEVLLVMFMTLQLFLANIVMVAGLQNIKYLVDSIC